MAHGLLSDFDHGGGGRRYNRSALAPSVCGRASRGDYRTGLSGGLRQEPAAVCGRAGAKGCLGRFWTTSGSLAGAFATKPPQRFSFGGGKSGPHARYASGDRANAGKRERLPQRSCLLEARLPQCRPGNPGKRRLSAVWSPSGSSRLCPAGYFQLGRRPPLGPFSRF